MSIRTEIKIARKAEVKDDPSVLPLLGQMESIDRIPDYLLPYCKSCLCGNIKPWYKSGLKTDDGLIICSSVSNYNSGGIALPQHVFFPDVSSDKLSSECQWISSSCDLKEPQYVGYIFDEKKLTLCKTTIVGRIGPKDKPGLEVPSPKIFKLEGTKDKGKTWEDITDDDVVITEPWSFLVPVELDFTKELKAHPEKAEQYEGFRLYIKEWFGTEGSDECTGLLRLKFEFLEDTSENYTVPNSSNILGSGLCVVVPVSGKHKFEDTTPVVSSITENIKNTECNTRIKEEKEHTVKNTIDTSMFLTTDCLKLYITKNEVKALMRQLVDDVEVIRTSVANVSATMNHLNDINEKIKNKDDNDDNKVKHRPLSMTLLKREKGNTTDSITINKSGFYGISGYKDVIMVNGSGFNDGDIVEIINLNKDKSISIHSSDVEFLNYYEFLVKHQGMLKHPKSISLNDYLEFISFVYLADENTFVCKIE